MNRSVFCFAVTAVILATGCAKKSSTSGASAGGGTGGSNLFTASQIQNTWTSACIAGSDPMSGADHYSISLALSGSSFNWSQAWYTGNCVGANYTLIYFVDGTFAVGGALGAGQSLTFTAASSSIMAMTTSAQTAVNADCGGTSPYASGVSAGSNGAHKNSYGALNCMHSAFANSGSSSISNIATFASSTLTIGAILNGLPGVLSGSAPTTVSIPLN